MSNRSTSVSTARLTRTTLLLAATLSALSSCALIESPRKGTAAGVATPPESVTDGHALIQPSSAQSSAETSAEVGLSGLSRSALWAHWNAVRGDPYELDSRERFIEDAKPRLVCDATELVKYPGKGIRYYGPVQVNEHFLPRLERFEAIVIQTAEEVYGRAPQRIRHYGAYACRSSRNRSHRLSEHALGNAIDIVGFDFGPATKAQPVDQSLPKQLKNPFQVRVARHWDSSRGSVNQTHARFLRTLIERLLDRQDVFRGVVGPGHRGHSDHFHFDMSPWRFVRM